MIKSFQIFLNMVLQKSKTLKIVLTRILHHHCAWVLRAIKWWHYHALKASQARRDPAKNRTDHIKYKLCFWIFAYHLFHITRLQIFTGGLVQHAGLLMMILEVFKTDTSRQAVVLVEALWSLHKVHDLRSPR